MEYDLDDEDYAEIALECGFDPEDLDALPGRNAKRRFSPDEESEWDERGGYMLVNHRAPTSYKWRSIRSLVSFAT